MFAVTAYPIGYAIYLSLQRADLRFPDANKFVGLENYTSVLSSSLWWDDFKTTVLFTVISVSIELVLGMALARGHAPRALRAGDRAGVDPHPVRDDHGGRRAGVEVRVHARHRLHRLVVRHRSGVAHGARIVALRHHRHGGVEDHALHGAAAARRPRARTREPHRGGEGRRRDELAGVPQDHLAAHEGRDPRCAAVPHPRRVPHVRHDLHPDAGCEQHREPVDPRLQPAAQPAQPRYRLGGLGADLPVRRDHRHGLRQGFGANLAQQRGEA